MYERKVVPRVLNGNETNDELRKKLDALEMSCQ